MKNQEPLAEVLEHLPLLDRHQHLQPPPSPMLAQAGATLESTSPPQASKSEKTSSARPPTAADLTLLGLLMASLLLNLLLVLLLLLPPLPQHQLPRQQVLPLPHLRLLPQDPPRRPAPVI